MKPAHQSPQENPQHSLTLVPPHISAEAIRENFHFQHLSGEGKKRLKHMSRVQRLAGEERGVFLRDSILSCLNPSSDRKSFRLHATENKGNDVNQHTLSRVSPCSMWNKLAKIPNSWLLPKERKSWSMHPTF